MENHFYTLIAFQNARNHYQAIILRQDFRKMCFGLHIPKYDNSAPDVLQKKRLLKNSNLERCLSDIALQNTLSGDHFQARYI